MKQTKHFTLKEDIHLTQTNFLIMILFHQKLVIGPKETGMRTQSTKLIGILNACVYREGSRREQYICKQS